MFVRFKYTRGGAPAPVKGSCDLLEVCAAVKTLRTESLCRN